MDIKFEIPEELLPHLEDDPQSKITLLLVFELYRENKITLRQAADILKVNYREMQEIFAKNKVYIDFGDDELNEEIKYGLGSKWFWFINSKNIFDKLKRIIRKNEFS